MKWMVNAFLMALAMSFASTYAIAAGAKQPKPTGMFTDMAYNTEGGDLVGDEIFVVYTNKGYFVVYQTSEGNPEVPAVIPAKVIGTTISFDVPAAVGPGGSFTGTVTSKGLTGSFSSNHETVHLKRKASYWQ